MAPKNSGRIVKAKNRYSTPHQKNHRWETFTAKIAKFNSLQPLRRVRRHDLETEDLSSTTSYFQTGLSKWAELNVSKAFVNFRRQVSPLCESLPQILHFEKRIMELLSEYISMQEKESLEPLLDLLTAFAHDLGVRFEKHYAQSLALIVAIAGRPQDVEVIEWTFGSLAFLFKYLSKLLVPNLVPTYQVVAPLLGRARHPPHIARFAAEALSFLVKKAGAPSTREIALPPLIEHIKTDIGKMAADRQFMLYRDGIMTMFAQAIKHTDNTIHSAGPAIFTMLMDGVSEGIERDEDESSPSQKTIWTDTVAGVLTSIIHHGTVDTFEEIIEAILDKIRARTAIARESGTWWQCQPSIRMLGVLAGVRHGTRIKNWPAVIQVLTEMLEFISKANEETCAAYDQDAIWQHVIVPTGVVWHHAPIDALIPHLGLLTQSLTKGPLMRWFVSFCSYACELDSSRFASLIRADFQRFIAGHWSQGLNEELICLLLPQMIENGGFPSAGDRESCKLPQVWQDQIVSKFENLEVSPFPESGPRNKDPQVWRGRCLPKYSALLRLLELASVHPSTNARISELLLRKLKLALRPSSTLATDEVRFIVSQGFHAYLRMSKEGASVDTGLSPFLRAAVPRFSQSVGFLEAYLDYEEHLGSSERPKDDDSSSDGSASGEDPVIDALVKNLASPSHEIRLASLKLLQQMRHLDGPHKESVEMMIEVEQLPLTLEHTRTISMILRNLGAKYSSLDDSTWVRQGVPSFAFGMLTVKLSPVWNDATEALQQITSNKFGEEAVSSLIFQWLDVTSPRWTPPKDDADVAKRQVVTDFDCTWLRRLHHKAEGVQKAMESSDDLLLSMFDERQQTAPTFIQNARSRALKVCNAIPSLVEKRSRQLVPYFLPWALEEGGLEDSTEGTEQEESYWSLADRKALLGVFSQFINPRVLYLHEKVYDGLLQLMENGDVEVQKLSLKAILAWKQVGVKAYQENLEFLLDDARFKNELTVFLQGDNVIKREHRQELMPVLLRLLYGRTISKKGAASGKHGLQATRLSVLRNLSVDDMGGFLDISMGRLKTVHNVGTTTARDKLFATAILPPRKQVGFLNMTASLISELGTNVSPYMEKILDPVLYCLVFACRQLTATPLDFENLDDDEDEGDEKEHAGVQSLLKSIRSIGIKCLNTLFQNAQSFNWSPYEDIIVEEVIAPRLQNLPVETAQSISGVLQLVATWSALPRVAMFLGPHGRILPDGILPKVVDCLAVEKAKDDVKIHVLSIIRNLVKLSLAPAEESEFNELIKTELLDENADATLENITTILRAPTTSVGLLEACVEAMLSLAQALNQLNTVESVLKISSFLLQQPPRRVNPRTKGRVLLAVENFVTLINAKEHQILCDEVYDTLAFLFSYFKDRENRQSLSRALAALTAGDEDKTFVSDLCTELNSYKEGRIDEPDYDRRLAAYNTISHERQVPLTPQQWLPILHNCIFFMQADEEFGVISTNSADALRRLVQDAIDRKSDSVKSEFEHQLGKILMPAIYAGAREPSETVRREYLRVLGFIVFKIPEWSPVKDMGGLLVDMQEEFTEPPFFFNILSPALARQMEALQMLESINLSNEIGSQNLAQFFIPLLEHFIFGRVDGSDDKGLGAAASNTIGSLAQSLDWKHYRTTLQRYIGYIGSKPDMQKQTIRLLGKFTDALAAAAASTPVEAMDIDQGDASPSAVRRLARTMPTMTKLTTDVVDYFLPMLVKHLHEKDESEVSYRVPVGVTIVKLLKLLPETEMTQRLASVLTDICYILRSKSMEARDMARDTLVQISKILGPSFFGFVLKQLRGALTRGYQLHVLSYTVHAMLIAVVPSSAPGDLDYCLGPIVTVIMDDIFGVIGQEKDAEGYTNQMKEIKSSKSQDSMELLAKNASITHLVQLTKPLQALLMQKVDLKMIRKIDILMGRISSGLLQNPASDSRDTLVFCYEVIQSVYKAQRPETVEKIDPRILKYLVQKGAKKGADRGRTTKNTHKLMRFAIDILRAMFKKHDGLRTPENLEGFLPILGDAILDGEDEVKISTFRLLAVIVKVPFTSKEGADIYKVAVKEATKSISQATSTTTELAQGALKMLAVVLRDRKDIVVKDAAVDMLLDKLKDDLTDPQYRHVTFNFVRSILERHIETATVYDIMDYVGTVMITNDDKDTRDLARGAFFQFIREYPQKKARWAKQLNFIVANLKYDREGGRLSVMEVVHLLLLKSSDDFVQEVAATCFLPLFFVLANDDSEKCRVAAGELIKEIFRRADRERTSAFLNLLRTWLEKDENILRLAHQVWAYYFESNENSAKNQKDFRLVLGKALEVLTADNTRDVDGELVKYTLDLVNVLLSVLPDKILAADSENLWTIVGRRMGHPHVPVKVAAIKLISQYLADFGQRGGANGSGKPIKGSYGLELTTARVQDLVRLALNVLNGVEVDETLATEAGQILIFLGPSLEVSTTEETDDGDDEDKQDEDDENEEDDEGDNEASPKKQKDLQYLFYRLSHILRKEIRPKEPAISSKITAMEVLETLSRRSPTSRLTPSFKTILTPLHHLTDPSIPTPVTMDEAFKTKHEHLRTRAQIVMDALQKKFGTAEYSRQLMAIREEVKTRRMQRSSKRKIEAIAQPEKYGRDKRKKFEKEKGRRKIRSAEQKQARQAFKGW